MRGHVDNEVGERGRVLTAQTQTCLDFLRANRTVNQASVARLCKCFTRAGRSIFLAPSPGSASVLQAPGSRPSSRRRQAVQGLTSARQSIDRQISERSSPDPRVVPTRSISQSSQFWIECLSQANMQKIRLVNI